MESGHLIAIFGGAVAGSEAASELSGNNVRTVVFEQNILPYGKLESGLPKWHFKLRDRQEGIINDKLNNPLVTFVPDTKLGRDLDFEDFMRWGFTAVMLATGAWRDRPLPIKGVEQFAGKGLYYQNPFVTWFNQKHDPEYKGAQLTVPDDTIIIGGGLASIDMAKIVMIESTRNALLQKGIDVDEITLEHRGIPATLEVHGFTMGSLGLKGCRLFTRHDIGGMPLTVIPDHATQEDVEKASATRQKILAKVQEKFPFTIVPNMAPVDKMAEGDRLTGIVFQETEEVDGKFRNKPDSTAEVQAPLVISAIGSVPELIPGIPLKGEIYDVENTQTGKIAGVENVYALGNAVTGRGNIRQSQLHSRQVSENIVDQYLAWKEDDYNEIFNAAAERVGSRIQSIVDTLRGQTLLSGSKIEKLLDRAAKRQKEVGFDVDYKSWIDKHLPVRLEKMIQE